MNSEFTLAMAFATGIFGAFHCLGMCSGINGGFFVRYGGFPGIAPVVSFHAMRIAVYTVLGVAGALLGQVLIQAGIVGKLQGILMIVAGVLVTLLGLDLLGALRFTNLLQPRSITVNLKEQSRPDNRPSRITPLIAGLFNGFVPCSLVFSVAVKAASTADPMRACSLMLAFGAGTLPAMVGLSMLGSYIGTRIRGLMVKLAGLTVILLGLWTIYEGLIFYDIMRGLANW